MNRRRCVGLGAKLDGAGAADNLRAGPERTKSIRRACQAEEIERVGYGVGVERRQAVEEGGVGHDGDAVEQ